MTIIVPKPRVKRVFTLEDLCEHHSLAIDFDGTLVGHDKSHLLQEFIYRYRKEKEFHIVTFRSHGREKDLAEDLRESVQAETGTRIQLHNFRDIHNMPDDHYARYNQPKLPEFYQWKPIKCKEIGCTILIDDMMDFIHEHCAEHGVAFAHPDDLQIAF